MEIIFIVFIAAIVTLLYKLEQEKSRARNLLTLMNMNFSSYMTSIQSKTLEESVKEASPHYSKYLNFAFKRYVLANKSKSEFQNVDGIDSVTDEVLLHYLNDEELVICWPFYTVVTTNGLYEYLKYK